MVLFTLRLSSSAPITSTSIHLFAFTLRTMWLPMLHALIPSLRRYPQRPHSIASKVPGYGSSLPLSQSLKEISKTSSKGHSRGRRCTGIEWGKATRARCVNVGGKENRTDDGNGDSSRPITVSNVGVSVGVSQSSISPLELRVATPPSSSLWSNAPTRSFLFRTSPRRLF